MDQAVNVVGRLEEIDREAVRTVFEQRFTVERMARDYLSIYRNLSGVRMGAARLRRRKGEEIELSAVA